ncbi:sulfite exporter TauE/SafE family protein [Streptomyces sp. ISL-99]|uniref:nickel/cobalt transporter n=1 Tax=Streptomyces sp. ISL-99 TaxID=2819193 RepID=UPI0027E48ABF|nr:sulfite exporter TauE/SafE family protein [Streptomyces sp. ISL-99]
MTAAVLWLSGVVAPAAQAHPLGNFSINQYAGFTLHPDRVDVLAVTDTAEIPTLQAAPAVDTNGDSKQSGSERAAWATTQCATTAEKLAVTTPRLLSWKVASATFHYRPGQGGLRTGRLECRLHAPLDLTGGPVTLRVDTGTDPDRVGWHEITAKGVGTHLQHSTVPETSATRELRTYPRDLLATPLGDTKAQFTAHMGDQASGTHGTTPEAGLGDGLTARVEALSQHLTSLTGTQNLTLTIGLLAVLLSLILGAGHALLPGHGKTVMAAYLAGRRGSVRDAITVGATVTVTHTAGVIVIGLCLTTFSSLAGDTVLNWLGVVSGALVALVGAALLTEAVRRSRRDPRAATSGARPADASPPALVGASTAPVMTQSPHGHTHDHAHRPHEGAAQENTHGHTHDHVLGKPHRHGLFGHHHTYAHGPATDDAQPFTTRGLIGLGVAGGLVPSPSALVVLLGAIALGRTAFGAALVLAYGLGMAATLTAVGVLLVRLGDRVGKLADRPALVLVRRIAPHTALLTAALVLIVGLGLMARSLPPLL